jgi:glycosyltransferase involved in cell wall biosynthesis
VDNTYFQSQAKRWQAERESTRLELGVDENSFLVAFAGKLIPRKDPFTLLKAVGSLQLPMSILWIGEGELRGELEQRSIDLHHRNVFVGFQNQSQIGRYYAAADALVLPSLSETWGLVVNEAMNFGLPVIVSDKVGCAPDLVIPGKTGFIFPAGDHVALAGCLEALAIDPDLRYEMGQLAIEKVSEYSVELAAEGIIEAVKRV